MSPPVEDASLMRLVYLSTLSVGLTSSNLKEPVERWAVSNKRHDITGVLALDGERVCQILEGPHLAVQTLFQAIKVDPRHIGVTELSIEQIDARHFGQWGMVRRQMVDIVSLAFSL
ncbi:BLUF domain-containing protein [Aureimonas psammosilenae]|uniref:BLUF domain-containing protein n=1 Tax=Aureimonas psammosilenae TaxID=2495496 RepID=UPI0012612E97|nr:BLUF domain-containing protein [Aureimonas psammosilenae]